VNDFKEYEKHISLEELIRSTEAASVSRLLRNDKHTLILKAFLLELYAYKIVRDYCE
jgi:hypothetical protein